MTRRDEPHRLMKAIEALLEFPPAGVDVERLRLALSLAAQAAREPDADRRAHLLEDAHTCYAIAFTHRGTP
jgi:hypothetical protein